MTDRLVALAINSSCDYGVNTIGTSISGTFNKFRGSAVADSVNRSPVIEETMDTLAPASIYGGVYSVSGNIDGTLRGDPGSINMLNVFMGKQATTVTAGYFQMSYSPFFDKTAATNATLLVYDEQSRANQGSATYYTGLGLNSMEISLNVKDYAKVKFGFIARRGITTHGALGTAPTEPSDWDTYPMAVFYNAVLTFGGTTLETKGITIKAERKFDTDYQFIGSQFLQGLYQNGLSNLGGTLTLGAGEWDLLSRVINGTTSAGALDATKKEFDGSLANTMAKGTLVITLYKPTGRTADTDKILEIIATKCVVTDMNRSVQNRNMWEKTVSWQAELPSPNDFLIRYTFS